MHCCSRPLGGCFLLATCCPASKTSRASTCENRYRHRGRSIKPAANTPIRLILPPPPFYRRCPCSRPCLRLQRLPPVMCPEPNGPSPNEPLLCSQGTAAASERLRRKGPRGLNTHPPELAPSLNSRQLGLRSKASNDVVNQKGPSMPQSLGHDACSFGPRLAPSLIAS